MKWLVPLGFLGLTGLILLLIIYLIKPNFQKKSVSSTYVWKLSLQFRKKRNPINRLRDMLLLICQILAIIACTFVMAQPVLEAFRPEPVTQKIAVIDASASMLAAADGETRFARAVKEVKKLAGDVMKEEGEITVILAGEQAEYVTVRTKKDTVGELNAALDQMEENAAKQCCYGTGDVAGAMRLAEQVLGDTPQADVLYYTAKNYIDKGNVEVVDVSDPSDYNVAILDSVAILEENFYTFSVDVASYGRAADITLCCEVYGVNGEENAAAKFNLPVWLEDSTPQTVLFNAETTNSAGVYSYDYAYIYVSVNDSFYYDNTFYIYGGTKEKIRIQYASQIPNIFFRGNIMSLRDTLRSRWDIEFVEVNTNNKEAATEGFDFYIFERTTPKTMPKDGVVMFVNPPSMPSGTGVNMRDQVISGNTFLTVTGEHPVTKGVESGEMFVSECRDMSLNEDYEVLLTCYRADPAYAIKNTEEQKVVVMGFELQNSDGPMLFGFQKLFLHTFNYFFPSTITRYNFEVGESVELNARAPSLQVQGQGETITLTELPDTVSLSAYGTYTLTQTLFNGKTVVESFYVKIPNAESNFSAVIEELANPHVEVIPEDEDYDLLLYVAGALVLLLFIEWWLNSRMQ